ncbi:MAG: hypothetical protein CM15mP23_04700 [Cryomorphaceae bacterium]|nr:MAG: hypothetical protein CM15mP23_04700 [Cryomorphaceae bacterium]
MARNTEDNENLNMRLDKAKVKWPMLNILMLLL